jgi:hypothetical protein
MKLKLILVLLTLGFLSSCKNLMLNQEEWVQSLKDENIAKMRNENPNVEQCADIVLRLEPFAGIKAKDYHFPILASYNNSDLSRLKSDLKEAERYVGQVDTDLNNWVDIRCNEGLMSAHIYEEIEYRDIGNPFLRGSSSDVESLLDKVKDIKKEMQLYRERIEELSSFEYKEKMLKKEIVERKAVSEELHRSGYLDDISPFSTKETGPRYARCYYTSEFLGYSNAYFAVWALRTMDKAYFKKQLGFVNTYLADVSPVTEEERLYKAGRYFGRYCR